MAREPPAAESPGKLSTCWFPVPGKTHRKRGLSQGWGWEMCVFNKPPRGSYVYWSTRKATTTRGQPGAAEHALILLLEPRAAGPQGSDIPARATKPPTPLEEDSEQALGRMSDSAPRFPSRRASPSLPCAEVAGSPEQSGRVLGGDICQEERVIGLIYDTQHGTWLLSSITVAPHGGVHAL